MSRLGFSLLILVFFLGAAGCATDDSASDAGATSLSTEALDSGLVVRTVDHRALMEEIRERPGRVKLVNFWATWCAPCIKEFPDLVQIGKDFASEGVDVVFVSADTDALAPRVESFLRDQGVADVSYRQDWSDADFVRGFSSRWSGVLPTTFLFDESGEMIDAWEGARSYEEIAARLREVLS